MDFTFSEEHQMIRDMARKFVENEVKPLADKIDRAGFFRDLLS